MILRHGFHGTMRLRPCIPAALLLVLAAFACVSSPAPQAASDPIGCWYFDRNEAAAALNLPWGIRLSADLLTGWPRTEARGPARLAATLMPEGEADHPFAYWMPLPGDSIEIGHPGGGGLLLRLAVGDMAMTGVSRALGDVMTPGAPPRPERALRLTLAQCPAY